MIQPSTLINGRYRVTKRLGEGGMAVVFAAHDLHLGRDVAIKMLRRQFAVDPAFLARFEREARAAASLSHPNIIDIYDVGEDDGVPYLVMELIRGHALKALIASESPFHPDDVAQLIEQIGAALDHAHARGYVHRDVKPGNILIDEHGRARVVDFGIAKSLADSDLTEAGGGFGTAGYLSPEQAAGLMATPASDVYSAGVVAFEMLTGSLPFSAETPVGVAIKHLNEPAPAPSSLLPAVPPALDAILLRALDKDPTRRWQSVGELGQALRNWRFFDPPGVLATTRNEPPIRSGSGSLPTIIAMVLVFGALALLLWIGFRGQTGGSDRQSTMAPRLPQPTITGGISNDPVRNDVAVNPEPTAVAIVSAPTAESTETTVAPTIAPRAEDAIVVPDLEGFTIAGSSKALRPIALRVALGQPTFSDSISLNKVVSQDPPAGTSVPSGTVIRVSLSRGNSPFKENTSP